MRDQAGLKEQMVWDGLAKRPAGIIENASRNAGDCFASLFNGATRGTIFAPGGRPFFGKAEAERAWPEGWLELKRLGLVTWVEIEKCPLPHAPPMIDIEWSITQFGWVVRDDDLLWFRELMDARRSDAGEARGEKR